MLFGSGEKDSPPWADLDGSVSEGEQFIKKSEAFIRWFERLQRWVRKNCAKSEGSPGRYVGREALLLKDYGIKFTQL